MGSFLFTTIAAVVGVVVLAPSYATNIPTTNPGCTTGVLGAQNIANGSASLEPDFSANTINTTWYSDGQQVNGPTTCTYDSDLNLPAALSKPGYVFGGWRLKPRCEIPSSLVSNGNAYAAKRLDGTGDVASGGATAATYGLEQPGEWGVSWSNGDKVVGEAICSQTYGTYATTGTPDTTGTGNAGYCWCKVTGYIANGAEQCSLSSPAWMFQTNYGATGSCAYSCASTCAYHVSYTSAFRAALFGGLVAE